jgi:hypothetical protein
MSYVYDRDTGLLPKGSFWLESGARRATEDEIRLAALEDGILTQTSTIAESTLYRLRRTLLIPDIIFVAEVVGAPIPVTPAIP